MPNTIGADVWYLYHSGFAVSTPRHFLIFDYYSDQPQGASRSLAGGVIEPAEIADRDVLVFVSHGHGDHLNRRVFDWRDKIPKIRYILSDDFTPPAGLPGVTRLGGGQSADGGDFQVRTFVSTDIGVAFLVEVDGLTIFHAGDLNWWHWEGETDAYNRQMGEDFRRQIDLIGGSPIDLGFFPLDPRLAKEYAWGLDYYMRHTDTRLVFPMHFGEDYSVFPRIARDEIAEGYRGRIAEITRRGQSFHYDKG